MREKASVSDKFIRFSIGAKLVTIITILVLVSLGTITFLVSFMVRKDLIVTADENNFEINKRSSADTEHTLANVRSNAQILINVISFAGVDSGLSKQTEAFFFEENKQIAALVFKTSDDNVKYLINESFFYSKDIDSSLVNSYYEKNSDYYQRAVLGESSFLNAYKHFSMHLLALFFPLP